MILTVKTSTGEYDIVLERGALDKVEKYLDLKRKVMIVTDDGVPKEYSRTVEQKCKEAVVVTLPQGETSKSFENYYFLLEKLVNCGFTRTDCIVAVGGGVIGDLAGFAASSFMRGIDFYNIPTTVLSQVDSSIGGKVAIDFCGFKNIVGAFYPPKKVIIDADTLKTLPQRQISNGLAEAVKMALTSNKGLFEYLEQDDIDIDKVIVESLKIKKYVVEADEKESGLRKILNFGHTLAHAVEIQNLGKLYHGECVAIGMLPMCSNRVKERLIRVLEKLNLPTDFAIDCDSAIEFIAHDKKADKNEITVIFVEEIGSFEMRKIPIISLKDYI